MDAEKKELSELEELLLEIKNQEKAFLLIDLNNIKDEDKDLIKQYRRNLKVLYTKFTKKERSEAGDIDENYFKPSPTNKEEDKFQRVKQSAFDRVMQDKEKFYKKILFTFTANNMILLKKLQKSIETFNKYNGNFLSNNEKISDLELPELEKIKEDISAKSEIKKNNEFDIDFKPKKASPGMAIIDLKQLNNDNLMDDKFNSLLSEEGVKANDIEIDNSLNNMINDIKNSDNNETYQEDSEDNNEKFLSDNEKINKEELPKLEEIKDKIVDFKETISKMESLELAFKEINLNNINNLTLSIIKEYQNTLVKYTTEYSASMREMASASSTSVIYGQNPEYFKLEPQTDADKELENDYIKTIVELKEDVFYFKQMDLENIQESDIEWLKRFQAKLNVAYTFFDKETKKTM